MSVYIIEVKIRDLWTTLKNSETMNLTREKACNMITRVRCDSAETVSGLKVRIVPTDIINLEDL